MRAAPVVGIPAQAPVIYACLESGQCLHVFSASYC